MEDLVIRAIKGYRHKNYARTVDVADFAKKIVTGVGYGELIIGYKPRESKGQLEQRIRITQNRTTSVEEKTSGFLRQAFRKDKLKWRVHHEDNTQLAKLTEQTKRYGNDGQKAIEYCEQAALYYARIDPNAFYWVRQVVEGNEVYYTPTIFESKNVLDFKIKKGFVKYAVCMESETVTYMKEKESTTKVLSIYYFFDTKTGTIQTSIEYDADVAAYSTYYTANFSEDVLKTPGEVDSKKYITQIVRYDSKISPIDRIGYKYDPETSQQTYVTYFNGAVSQFEQLVKIGSEYDLSLTLHAFLQKIGYYVPCDHAEGASRCRNGVMYPEETTCKLCHGTGQKVTTTSQDSLMIKFPDSSDTVNISPKDLVWYVQLPIDIVKMQKEITAELEPEITKTIYGVDMTKDMSSNGARTAEEVRGFNDKAQDAIYDFTKSPKRMFLHTMEVIASSEGIEGLELELEYAPEYDLQSEGSLLESLKKAKDSGATPEITNSIKDRLINKQNRANPTLLRVHRAMRKLLPFAGVSDSLKEQVLMDLPYSDVRKSLYLNFNKITELMIEDAVVFLDKSSEEQQKQVYDLAIKMGEEMQAATSVLEMRDLMIEDEDIEL